MLYVYVKARRKVTARNAFLRFVMALLEDSGGMCRVSCFIGKLGLAAVMRFTHVTPQTFEDRNISALELFGKHFVDPA